MRDEKHGHPPLGVDTGHEIEHVFAQRRAERGERLVEQKHRTVAQEHPCQRDALPLAAGKFARQPPLLAGKADPRQRLRDRVAVGGSELERWRAAKPDIAAGEWQPWADGMARLAAETGAMCKLSGLLTEAGPAGQVCL